MGSHDGNADDEEGTSVGNHHVEQREITPVEHVDNHEAKAESFYPHPHEGNEQRVVQQDAHNGARNLRQ